MGYVCRLGLYFCLEPNRRAKLPAGSAFIYCRNGIKAALPHYNTGFIKNKGAASGCRDLTGKAITPPKNRLRLLDGWKKRRTRRTCRPTFSGASRRARKRLDKRQL